MNLITDIGNTSVKTALFEGKELVELNRTDISDAREKISTFCSNYKIDNVIISSVAAEPIEIISYLKEKGIYVHHLTSNSSFPFTSEYKTPDTLGVDRLAAAAGAVSYYGNANMLVIDTGSAVTFDIVAGGVFRGGTISPGMEMRFKALHTFTGRLPLCSFSKDLPFPATSTHNAISTGVVKGIIFEINEYIRTFAAGYCNPVTILTGGDAQELNGLIEGEYVCLPNLVIEGLNYLIEFNQR